MPMGKYKDFAACVSANSKKLGSKKAAQRYCGKIYWKTEGKKKLKKVKKEMENFGSGISKLYEKVRSLDTA